MKKRLLFLIVCCMFLFVSCHAEQNDMTALIGKKDTINNKIINKYEYSFITPKDEIIAEEESAEGVTRYISLGIPEEDTRSDNGLSTIKQDNGEVFLVNGYGLYQMKENRFEQLDENYMFSFDIYNGNTIYYDIRVPALYVLNSDGSQSTAIEAFDACIASDHIFYVGKDQRIRRMTVYQHEDVALSANTPASSLQYCNGWIYYLFDDDIWRIDIDGENAEQITAKSYVDDFIISDGRIAFSTLDWQIDWQLFNINGNQLSEMSIPEVEGYYKIIGIDQNNVYLSVNSLDYITESIIAISFQNEYQVLASGNFDLGYSVFFNGFIYYYQDGKLYRIDVTTKETMQVGEDYNHCTYE